MTSSELAERMVAALVTIDSTGRALGLTPSDSFEQFRTRRDGFSATIKTADGQEEWEVTVRKLS